MRVTFIETQLFARTAKGVLGDAEMRALGEALNPDPHAGDVEDDTGGARKIRVALPGRGKSGGARVLYVYVEATGRVFLIIAYPKNVQGSLTNAQKKVIRQLTAILKKERQSMATTTRRRPAPSADDEAQDETPIEVTDENFGGLVIESLQQAVAIQRGEMLPARQYTGRRTAREATAVRPGAYTAARVKRVRLKLKLSQPVFAEALNVSAATVRAWERGARTPEGSSRRLLEVAERHPKVVLGALRAR